MPFVRPRALQIEEMPYIVRQYARGARNALAAKFDGVEVHGANGYLIDQFINSGTNHRTDAYGGSVENRARLLMEVVEAVSEIWGPDRVGVRLSPLGNLNDISDAEPEATFGTVAQALSEYRFAYLHIVNPAAAAIEKGEAPDARAQRMLALIREKYCGTLIIAGGFDRGTAEAWLEEGKADLIAFGRKFLANPDLPDRLRRAQAAQCRRSVYLLWRRREGLYRLSVACAGTGRATESLRGRPVAVAPSAPFGLRLLSPVELPEKYGRSAATGIASAQNLTHLKR